ncbi:MAG TPA: Crp/Fnr family transcriptional regulator [Tepidisphaeraceae bacterium]
MSQIAQASTTNLLLRALSADDYALLAPHLRRVELPVRTAVVEPNKPIEQVHFPESGVVSVLTADENDSSVEFGLLGFEGMSGVAVMLRVGQTPHHSFVQVGPVQSLHLAADALLGACRRSETLEAVLLQYVHTLAVQSAATASANAHFALPERLARWLLMCHDRVEGDRLTLTHEFMSQMLAVRRSGVTVTLHALEGTGAIRSTRGLVTVRDRDRLAEIAGESYGSAEREYARLIASFGKSAIGPLT